MLIFGQHGLQIYASEHLTGKHNADLQNKLYLFLDEAIWAGDKEADRKLKTLTTEKWLMIEPKGINSFQWVNRLGLYMSGNDKWILPASHDTTLRRQPDQRTMETRQKLLHSALC